MRTIKRYPNRKLYDTEAKKYITLNGIAELIREGEEVQVVDHASGEDLTAITLTQIIFEREKQEAGFLPRSVLTGLIQAGGDRLSTLRRTLASPLDLLHHVDEEIDRRIRTLIRLGDIDETEGRSLREMLIRPRTAGHPSISEQELEQLLADQDIPTQEDLRALEAKLETLIQKLNAVLQDQEPA
jgi:polyhydroxyalkanoate synthesis repressor PhaR